MPLTKISAGVISDDSITTTKIGAGQVGTTDIANNAITADKLDTILNLSSKTLTLPANSITATELENSHSSSDYYKFLQLDGTGNLRWFNPQTVPIPFSSVSGSIASSQIDTGTITNAMLVNQTIEGSKIAPLEVNDTHLTQTLDLSSKTLTFPTNIAFTNITVSGTLTVSGTTTTIDTNTLNVKDRIITVNQGESGAGISNGTTAGIEIDRGTSDNGYIIFDETLDKFQFKIGGNLATVEYADQGAVPDSVGYTELKLTNTTDPGAGNNYFLESDGTGRVQFAQVNPSSFNVAGVVTGTLGNTNLAPGSVKAIHLDTNSVTSGSLSPIIDFTGKTAVLNPNDVKTAINASGAFVITNTGFELPPLHVTGAKIAQNTITVDKLATTLDFSNYTITLPAGTTDPQLNSIDQSHLKQDSVHYSELATSNAGITGQILSLDTGNTFKWIPMEIQDPVWLGGFWPDVKENYSFAVTFSNGDMTVTMKNRDGNDLDNTQSLNSGYSRFGFRSANKHESTYTVHKQTSNIAITIPKLYGLDSLIGDSGVSTGWRRLYVYGYLVGGTTMKLAISGKIAVDEGTTQNTVLFTSDTAPGLNNKLYGVDAQTGVPIRLLGRILAQNWSSANGWSSTNSDIELSVHFHTNQYEFV